MSETFTLVEKHLYKRQYQTSAGEWATSYVARFVDWKGVRRKFALGDSLEDARDELGQLRTLNKGRHDWDAEKKKARAKGMTLAPWIERFMSVKAKQAEPQQRQRERSEAQGALRRLRT